LRCASVLGATPYTSQGDARSQEIFNDLFDVLGIKEGLNSVHAPPHKPTKGKWVEGGTL